MIAQALDSGKEATWTVIMIGGGHFAAAVFQGNFNLAQNVFTVTLTLYLLKAY